MEGIQEKRKAAGLTQQELADAIGCQRGALSMWEAGKSWPPAKLLPKLAEALQCSIEELYESRADGQTGSDTAFQNIIRRRGGD